MLKPIIKVCAISMFIHQANAATLHVNISGDDTNACSQTEPCASIQEAVNKAANKDTILVAPGTYNESLQIRQK